MKFASFSFIHQWIHSTKKIRMKGERRVGAFEKRSFSCWPFDNNENLPPTRVSPPTMNISSIINSSSVPLVYRSRQKAAFSDSSEWLEVVHGNDFFCADKHSLFVWLPATLSGALFVNLMSIKNWIFSVQYFSIIWVLPRHPALSIVCNVHRVAMNKKCSEDNTTEHTKMSLH